MSNISNVAVPSIILSFDSVSDMAMPSSLVCTCDILIVTLVFVVCFSSLRWSQSWLLLLLLSLILLICRQSLFQCLLLEYPIIHEVEVKTFPYEGFSKHWDDLLIIRTLFEFQFSRVIEKMSEFFRISISQIFDASNGFFHFDLFILFFLRLCR